MALFYFKCISVSVRLSVECDLFWIYIKPPLNFNNFITSKQKQCYAAAHRSGNNGYVSQ